MELGNMIFGNSRGEYPVDRSLQDEWYGRMEALGFDGYGYHELSDDEGVFENDVFRMQPYYWGDCTCGFDQRDYQWSKDHRHSADCYQSKLKRSLLLAGGQASGEFDYVERPDSISYDDWQKIERDIYRCLCAENGLDPEYGCAVHCTCSHDADYQAWRQTNSHAEDCRSVTPNFLHKPSGFRLDWYKYPLRDSYSSAPLTIELMHSMFDDCARSMGPRDRDATPREREAVEGEASQPGPEGDRP